MHEILLPGYDPWTIDQNTVNGTHFFEYIHAWVQFEERKEYIKFDTVKITGYRVALISCLDSCSIVASHTFGYIEYSLNSFQTTDSRRGLRIFIFAGGPS
jgi:hypothetical protein